MRYTLIAAACLLPATVYCQSANRTAPPPYRYEQPPTLKDGWRTAHIDAVGLDRSKLEALVRTLRSESGPGIHAILIERAGALVFEEYFAGRESVMGSELMTGFAGPSTREPLSLITVGSLADLQYAVSFYGANAYTVSASRQSSQGIVLQPRGEVVSDLGFVIDEVTGVVRPRTLLDVSKPRSALNPTIPRTLIVPSQVLQQRRRQ